MGKQETTISCYLLFCKFHIGGNNVGGIVLKFGGFQMCFDGVQGSSTLFLGILGVFPICFSEFELVPFCLHHLTNVFTKLVMRKKKMELISLTLFLPMAIF
jgi:hypothetical protein